MLAACGVAALRGMLQEGVKAEVFRPEDALHEADRCLLCPDPACVGGCPVSIDIPGFIRRINDKDFRGAYEVIGAANLLPAICGRVCPQENQCEGVCTVGESLEPVAIGRLERFVRQEGPQIAETPEAGLLFGQPVANLVEWAEVAASSEPFARKVVLDYWRLLVGEDSQPGDEVEFATLVQRLSSKHEYRVERMLRDLIAGIGSSTPDTEIEFLWPPTPAANGAALRRAFAQHSVAVQTGGKGD